MTKPTAPTPADRLAAVRWTRVRLIHPSASGFVYIGANSGPWRLPIALPTARRASILSLMNAAADALRDDPRVVRAEVFRALLRPPGGRVANDRTPPPAFDAVLLVETTTVAAAAVLLQNRAIHELLADLQDTADRTLMFAASNARRIGPVDHDHQGVFLFNYFSADDVEATLRAWQYTAGWFQDETGLDNSTVLQPVAPGNLPYTVVNHCRWHRLRDVLPSLVLKGSFRSFVLRVFADHRVIPHPILYRLHRPSRALTARLSGKRGWRSSIPEVTRRRPLPAAAGEGTPRASGGRTRAVRPFSMRGRAAPRESHDTTCHVTAGSQ